MSYSWKPETIVGPEDRRSRRPGFHVRRLGFLKWEWRACSPAGDWAAGTAWLKSRAKAAALAYVRGDSAPPAGDED